MRPVTTRWMGVPALLLATIAVLALACDGSRHPTAPPPAQPPVSSSLGGVWVGERSVANVLGQGRDTCLGRVLATSAPSQVRLEWRQERGLETFFGDLDIGDAGESCKIWGRATGTSFDFNESSCNVHCWLESFECDGQLWSFCRKTFFGINDDYRFQGKFDAGRLTGFQNYRFYATAGTHDNYDVELVLFYDLHR